MAKPTKIQRWRKRLSGRLALLDRALREHRRNPTAKSRAKVARRRAQVAYARRVIKRWEESRRWGGCRAVTNRVIEIVDGRARVTSRKRVPTFGNPGSDHHVSQRNADAVDFAIAEAHWLKNEISRRLGGPRELPDYGSFHIEMNDKRFRVQIIAGTHGTGPHLHVGVRRA